MAKDRSIGIVWPGGIVVVRAEAGYVVIGKWIESDVDVC